MNIHEYQAKGILRRNGVACGDGVAGSDLAALNEGIDGMPGPVWVVKSQIHAGGRGMGRFKESATAEDLALVVAGEKAPGKGGVRVCFSAEDAKSAAADMLGNTLVTKQTGLEGKQVNTLYIENGCSIATELYIAVLLDRGTGQVLVMASTEGGMDIEHVAEHTPEKIVRVWADPVTGLGGWQARQLAFELGLKGKPLRAAVKLILGLYRTYIAEDCEMLEINPLVLTEEGDVLALDCKMSFDDNALFRHADTAALRDETEEDPAEIEAGKYDLSFIKLDGSIGCMVNGAGLAMATMDIIKFHGYEPANFLDVGGGANEEKVTAAFKIITADPNVKGILVNIFGGIMKCDVIAAGVIGAVKQVGLKVPLVVRLAGTNVELGKKLLEESGLDVIPANDMADAARKITEAVSARES
ncbi:MAG: ADP-forming succinate--CoA ligase subunit beta [Proteobacteria bacterium]|nr:ADP-forming succinate--CoA ligase subunit beta [Pseudomonadota bacterium]MCP4915530.1 ADP-forming succinate--CoA ligase subunit beta [Pseudomonadota bacterium]